MIVEKLYINKIKNKVIVLKIKQKISRRKCIINREFNLVLGSNEDLKEISMVSQIKDSTIDYQGTKVTHQHRTTQIKVSNTFNNNKK